MDVRKSRAAIRAELDRLKDRLMDIWIQEHFDHNEALAIQIEMHRLQRILREIDDES